VRRGTHTVPLDVSDRTAYRDLELLVERGRLKGIGQRAARRYVLA